MSKIVHSRNFAARITTADSLDIRIQSHDCPYIHFNIKATPDSGHTITPHNREFFRSKLYANNTNDPGLVEPRRPFQQDCPPSLLFETGKNLTLD